MSHQSDQVFLALHTLRVRGFVPIDDLSHVLATDVDVAHNLLEQLRADEMVMFREGRVTGWRATPAGVTLHANLLAADVTTDRAEAIHRIHHDFTPLNGQFKQVCTDWQLRDGEINDHSDPTYDLKVVGALEDVHHEVVTVISSVEQHLLRFSHYRPRLIGALQRVKNGDQRAFTAPLAQSYHDVWMELHQDFILSLSLTRGEGDA